MRVAVVALIIVNLFVLLNTHEPEKVKKVREKYTTLREALVREGKFPELHDPVPLTAYYRTWDGALGYNVNKGFELGVCIDGEVNEVFHILLHELAHCTVKEYNHSEAYWKNYVELRDIAVSLGIYEKIPEKTPFCGKEVQDK
jgi:hypothetical protein